MVLSAVDVHSPLATPPRCSVPAQKGHLSHHLPMKRSLRPSEGILSCCDALPPIAVAAERARSDRRSLAEANAEER